MANKKSSQKDIRKTAARTLRNRTVRSRIKTLSKAAEKAEGAEAIKASGAVLASAVDKAVKKGVVHANKAARIKSRVAKALNAAK
ncbi:MAG: 30S ribosomal protein S20 [Opitutales bacterium]|nr:30S ribosomal protein S20 [Opitutales bacterium]